MTIIEFHILAMVGVITLMVFMAMAVLLAVVYLMFRLDKEQGDTFRQYLGIEIAYLGETMMKPRVRR